MTFGDISFSNSSLEQPIENITPKQSTEKDSFEMDKNNPVYYAEKLLYDERKAEEEKEQQHDKEIIDAHRQYIRSLIHHKTKDIEEQQQKIKNPIFEKAAYSSTKDGSSFHTASWSKLRPEDMKDAYIAISRNQGIFLYDFLIQQKAKHIVEFGTSFGISTLYLGAAAKVNGGQVITTELLANKCKIARANFEKAFKRLIDFADDFADNSHQSQVIIKSAEFNALIDDKMTGFLPYGEYKKYRNEIISNVLLLMDAIADSYSDY